MNTFANPASKSSSSSASQPVTPFLRKVLLLDAVSSAGMGLLTLLLAAPLSPLLGLSPAFLQAVGWILLPFAAFVAWAGTRAALLRPAVWLIIGVNALWVIESVAVLLLQWVQPTTLGYAAVLAQAAFVGLLAELEFVGLRRAG